MQQWHIVAFGKICDSGFMTGKAVAPDASRAVELSGEPTAIAFPCLEFGIVAPAQESFTWNTPPGGGDMPKSW